MSCSHKFETDNDKSVFRYNEASGISSLDPAFAKDLPNIWGCNQVFNGLVQLNDQMEVIPCIAKEWNISEDGLTYTFLLRNDVYFHENECFGNQSTRIVTAYDFEYSFKRVVSKQLASPSSWVFAQVDKASDGYHFKALNDSVFEIKLKHAFPPFLGILSMKYCSVVPKEAIDAFGVDFRSNPIGTGPFYFKYWKEGSKLVFLKNEKYFEFDGDVRLPHLDAVSVSFLIDKQAAFLLFVQGQLDFMSGIDASYKDELLTEDGNLNPKFENDIKMQTQPYLNLEYLGILVDKEKDIVKQSPLNDVKVRKAINYAFDRKKMMRYLRNNIGEPALSGVIPKGLPSFSGPSIGYTYDPEKAKQLLIEAGFSNSKPKITITTNAEYLDLCRYIQFQLNEVGFDASIDVNPAAALRELKAQTKLNFFRASWIADYPDGENYLSMFYSKNFAPNGPNYTHYSNPKFDELYESALMETDPQKRIAAYKMMDKMIMDDAVIVPMYYDQVLRFTQSNIEGLGVNAVNLLNLKRVKKIDVE